MEGVPREAVEAPPGQRVRVALARAESPLGAASIGGPGLLGGRAGPGRASGAGARVIRWRLGGDMLVIGVRLRVDWLMRSG